ncbi:hypothetical protein CLRAG_34060 [Clostridium ragsdalei P11]|uniref:ABC-type cobalt transport system, permease component n=1 Tax=Clostridium ragsdalei P11 TaxID=1353534 RepID=A0A1A6AL95_9CLOT|nr:ECF transporter S component [Clostridium ragsdalei]OBR90758.1 hypothetical protein CLRAG_34060 [Clostridium ragsdalei P11]
MKLWKKFITRFTIFELALIALISALGIAAKPVVASLGHVLTAPLLIPGGSVIGGLYMMWIVLGAGLVTKSGAGTLIGLTQGMLIMFLGFFGNHGAFSLVTYALPGVSVDLVLKFMGHRVCCPLCSFLSGAAANITGTFLVSSIFFNLPWIALFLCLSVSMLSGGLGGILAYLILKKLRKVNIGTLNYNQENKKNGGDIYK